MMDSYLLLPLIFLSGALISYLLLLGSKKKMEDRFKSLSFDVMQKNNESFLSLANQVLDKQQMKAESNLQNKQQEIGHLLAPLKETLNKLNEHNREIEKRRESAFSSLGEQISLLRASESSLRDETRNLVRALKSPNIRGSWGQVHLRRVVELSGMLNRCDFFEQVDVRSDSKIIRPDLVVKLPGDREIIVDAKAPLEAYIDATEAENEDLKQKKLLEHAQHVKRHVKELASKEYFKQFARAPEYVILFLPAEAFFSAALQADPSLLELGMNQNVIVATPTTLIAILKAVAYSWRQENASKEAEKIMQLGKELYERISVMSDHLSKLGRTLTQSVDSYNQTISSMESRVLVSARKLKDPSFSKELKELEQIEKAPKRLSSLEN